MKSSIPIGLSLNGALVAFACLSYLPTYLTTYMTFSLNNRGCPCETQHQFTVGTVGFHQQLSCNTLCKGCFNGLAWTITHKHTIWMHIPIQALLPMLPHALPLCPILTLCYHYKLCCQHFFMFYHHVFTLYIAASCIHIFPHFDLVKKSFENTMQKNYKGKKALKILSR